MLLLIVFIASCKGQNKTDLIKDSKSQQESNLPDDDPYFIETKAINTSFGPGNITRNIMQDRKGNIWLATWEGIIRYKPSTDQTGGKAFTNFTNKEGLRRFHVFSVLEDSKGKLWFGTIGAGAYRYDRSAEQAGGKSFTNFTTKDGLANDRIECIYEDKTGKIWFGTEEGASCYDPSAEKAGGKPFRNYTTKEGLTNNDVHSIIEDKNGIFWFGTRGDVCSYDPNAEQTGKKAFTNNITNTDGVTFKNVWSIIEDRNGNIWLGGNDGLWLYDGSSFTNFTTDFVGYIYEDKMGNIWISAGEGLQPGTMTLYRYPENSLLEPVRSTYKEKIKEVDGLIFGIFEDKDGGIWFGTLNGVCRYAGNTFNYFNDTGVKE
jgi:ligand-binding sensor domain-containing protein